MMAPDLSNCSLHFCLISHDVSIADGEHTFGIMGKKVSVQCMVHETCRVSECA